jgi:hypothetical protein
MWFLSFRCQNATSVKLSDNASATPRTLAHQDHPDHLENQEPMVSLALTDLTELEVWMETAHQSL